MQSCLERIVNLDTNIRSDDFKKIGSLDEKSFIRNRKLTYPDIQWLILNKKGMTQAMELYSYYKIKKAENVTVQAFSKARKNLNPDIFTELNKSYLNELYSNVSTKYYDNRVLLAVDGCVQELWDNEKLKEIYGGTTNKNGEVTRVKVKTCAIYDCLNHMIIDFQMGPYKTSEKELSILNIENALNFFKNDEIILIFDRGFPSIELFNYLIENNIKFLARLKKVSYKKEKEEMKTNDECINIEITKNRMTHIKDEKLKKQLLDKKEIRVRITKIPLENDEEEHLVSNFYKDELDYFQIKDLYAKRWEIEKSFDVLKSKLQIENISGESKIAIEQDFKAQILVHNVIQDIKNEAEKGYNFKKKENINIK